MVSRYQWLAYRGSPCQSVGDLFLDESSLGQDKVPAVGKHIALIDNRGDFLLLSDRRNPLITTGPPVEVRHIQQSKHPVSLLSNDMVVWAIRGILCRDLRFVYVAAWRGRTITNTFPHVTDAARAVGCAPHTVLPEEAIL